MADTSGSRRHVLWMGRIPPGTTKQDVEKYFEHYNIPIQSTTIPHDSMTGQNLGFAYVIFATEEDMRSARERANYGHIQNLDVLLCPVERDPTLRRSGKGNLYVRGFPEDGMTPREIHSAFSSFGPVFSVRRSKGTDGQYLPFGYVRFENPEDAQACLQAAQEKTGIFAEMDLLVEPYKTKQDRSADTQNRNLYFRGFPDTLSEADIRAHFAAHGSIDSFTIRTSDDHDARFGFCSFMTHEDAAKAKSALSGATIDGSEVLVNWFSSRRRRDTLLSDEARRRRLDREKEWEGRNLYVKNLAETVDESKLREFFERWGEVESVRVLYNTEGVHRGIGFVCFVNREAATTAHNEARSIPLEGKPVFCQIATSRTERRRPGNPVPAGYMMSASFMPQMQWATVQPGMGMPMSATPLMQFPMPPQAVPPQAMPPPVAPPVAERSATIVDNLFAVPAGPERYQAIGNYLYPKVDAHLNKLQATVAPTDRITAEEVTGLLLELDDGEMRLLLTDEEQLKKNIEEAMDACHTFRQQDEP